MTYAEAMRRYGSDKPDLRFEMELDRSQRRASRYGFCSVSLGARCERARSNASSSKARPITRESRLDELQEFVKRYGAGALAWIKVGGRNDFVAC